MSLRALRRVVLGVCVVGVVGMIVTSVVGRNGGAIAFGLSTATAILVSMAATAVTAAPATGTAGEGADEHGAAIEARVAELVRAGADEAKVRALVKEAVRFGSSRRPPGPSAPPRGAAPTPTGGG